MISYPTSLPLPDTQTYSGTIDVGLLRTQVPSARAAHFINNNTPTTEISMTFKMKNDLYTFWLSWALNEGYRWFNMPVVSAGTPANITSEQRVRFISDIQLTKLGDNWLSVTVAAEIVPGDFLL